MNNQNLIRETTDIVNRFVVPSLLDNKRVLAQIVAKWIPNDLQGSFCSIFSQEIQRFNVLTFVVNHQPTNLGYESFVIDFISDLTPVFRKHRLKMISNIAKDGVIALRLTLYESIHLINEIIRSLETYFQKQILIIFLWNNVTFTVHDLRLSHLLTSIATSGFFSWMIISNVSHLTAFMGKLPANDDYYHYKLIESDNLPTAPNIYAIYIYDQYNLDWFGSDMFILGTTENCDIKLSYYNTPIEIGLYEGEGAYRIFVDLLQNCSIKLIDHGEYSPINERLTLNWRDIDFSLTLSHIEYPRRIFSLIMDTSSIDHNQSSLLKIPSRSIIRLSIRNYAKNIDIFFRT